jgi:hypothetical protein
MDGLSNDETESLLYTFENVDLIDFHKTTKIKSFQTIIDENRYLFKNDGSKPVKYLFLRPRPRERERELKVYDQNHASLPLIPQEKANSLLIIMCEKVIDSLLADLEQHPPEKEFQSIKNEIRNDLKSVFEYPPNKKSFKRFKVNIEHLISNFEGDEQFIDRILRLTDFLESYAEGKYCPLIFLTPKNRYQEVILVDESVKVVDKSTPFEVSYIISLFGRINFLYKIEPKPSVPCTYGVVTPKGLVMKNIHFDLEGKPKKHPRRRRWLNKEESERIKRCRDFEKRHNRLKKEYFDSDYFHLALNESESEDISKSKKRIIKISFGLSERKLNFGILTILVTMLWVCLLFPSWSWFLNRIWGNLFPGFDLTMDQYLLIVGVSTPLIVAIAIYAIDKTVLRDFIAMHMFLLTAFFLYELLFFETIVPTFLKVLLLGIFLFIILIYEIDASKFLRKSQF